MTILCLDPGKTTGYVVQGTGFACGQLEQERIWNLLEVYKPTVVVYERFMQRGKMAVDLEAVEVIGIIKKWCRDNGIEPIPQTPEAAKHFWTNDRLKVMGLYQRGLPHANDAIRHLCHFLHFNPAGPHKPLPPALTRSDTGVTRDSQ